MQKNCITCFIIFLFIIQSITLSAQAPVSYGDVNSGGSINIVDALMVAQYYVGLIQTFAYPEAADVNKSGTVDVPPVRLVKGEDIRAVRDNAVDTGNPEGRRCIGIIRRKGLMGRFQITPGN